MSEQKRGRGRPPKSVTARFAKPIDETTVKASAAENIPFTRNDTDDMDSIIQQIHDREMAAAIDDSLATYASNTNAKMYHDEQMIESDRLLAEQLANVSEMPAQSGDDIEEVLEQIRQMEEKEKFAKSGNVNAYEKPLNLDRVIAMQDDEDENMRKMNDWRSEKAIQDMEYEELLADTKRKDLEKSLQAPENINTVSSNTASSNSATTNAEFNTEYNVVDVEEVPKTREELRTARLKFFDKK
jgi:Fe2+ transport system protein B